MHDEIEQAHLALDDASIPRYRDDEAMTLVERIDILSARSIVHGQMADFLLKVGKRTEDRKYEDGLGVLQGTYYAGLKPEIMSEIKRLDLDSVQEDTEQISKQIAAGLQVPREYMESTQGGLATAMEKFEVVEREKNKDILIQTVEKQSMDFSSALMLLRGGQRIYRSSAPETTYWLEIDEVVCSLDTDRTWAAFDTEDVLADDWKVR